MFEQYLLLLLETKRLAKEARSRGRRCHYTEDLKLQCVEFYEWVKDNGGTVEDAAELLTVNRRTLEGWIELTTPACECGSFCPCCGKENVA